MPRETIVLDLVMVTALHLDLISLRPEAVVTRIQSLVPLLSGKGEGAWHLSFRPLCWDPMLLIRPPIPLVTI